MTNKIILYGNETSPPVRACLFTLTELNLDFTFEMVDTYKNDHRAEEYVKKNPSHTIPLLEIDGHYIADSHAIIAFLASKFDKNGTLYPTDLYQRVIVDQLLHYEGGRIFPKIIATLPQFIKENQPREKFDELVNSVRDVFDVLESYLNQTKYIVGDNLTIADLSLMSTVPLLVMIVPLDADKYPKLVAWLGNLEKLPYFAVVKGIDWKKRSEEKLKPALEKYRV